jgi:hypothetical protein
MDEDKDFLRQDNNYRTLKAFQKAECIYMIWEAEAQVQMHRGDPAVHFWTDSNGDSEVARQTQDHSSGLHRCGPEMIVLQTN